MTSLDHMNSLNPWLVAILLNTALGVVGWLVPKKLLTPAGLVHAWALGILLWGTIGWRGYLVVMLFFLVGSTATRIGIKEKEAQGIAEKRAGARGPENVWGSAFTGALCALATLVMPASYRELLILGFVASFSTKMSDTCASEVGKAYGKRTFLITTLQPVPRGTEGAVSLEGTLAGILASGAISLFAWAVGLVDLPGVSFCVLAALIATNVESVIGATLQSQFGWLTNEVVNILNTLIGAIAAVLIAVLVKGLV